MNAFLFFVFFLTLVPLQAFALADVSVNTSIDQSTLQQGWPIKGTLELTHYADQKVDEGSATLNGKPLKINLLRSVKISPESSLTVSIYQFSLPSQNKGSYTLSPISLKVAGKSYQTLPISYEVQGPISLPPASTSTAPQENSLKLEAYIEGPQELYPGQITKLVYRYIYQGNIALSKETLPMLEAKGMQKIGRNEIKNYTEGNNSIFEISQKVQADKPGEYAWGPSVIEGIVYVEDVLGNKQFTTTKLTSEAAPVKLVVKAFPLDGKPASFNGAFGKFTFKTSLTSPAKVSVGDPITLNVIISGKTSNWSSVNLPELCCQPGFGGFFKLSDLPPIGKLEGDNKQFIVEMSPLSSVIKSIPAIQFSFFDPEDSQYKTLYSDPIALSVSPMQDIAEADQKKTSLKEPSYQSPETANEWLQIYQQIPPLDSKAMYVLKTSDLENKPFGSWWILWLIPASMAAWALQFILKNFWERQAGLTKKKNSSEVYKEMLKAPPASTAFFQLLHQCLILRLYERGEIDSEDLSIEQLPREGSGGKVRDFLMHVDSVRYTNTLSDETLYHEALEEGKRLYRAG